MTKANPQRDGFVQPGIIPKYRLCLKCQHTFYSNDGSRLCDDCNRDNIHVVQLPGSTCGQRRKGYRESA